MLLLECAGRALTNVLCRISRIYGKCAAIRRIVLIRFLAYAASSGMLCVSTRACKLPFTICMLTGFLVWRRERGRGQSKQHGQNQQQAQKPILCNFHLLHLFHVFPFQKGDSCSYTVYHKIAKLQSLRNFLRISLRRERATNGRPYVLRRACDRICRGGHCPPAKTPVYFSL